MEHVNKFNRNKFNSLIILYYLVNQQQVRTLAKKFPHEEHDTFYSHTQRAFSRGNHAETEGKTYVFNCKKTDKKTLDVKQKNQFNE